MGSGKFLVLFSSKYINKAVAHIIYIYPVNSFGPLYIKYKITFYKLNLLNKTIDSVNLF